MKLNGSQMRVKYHCDLCAEKNRRKCYSKGVCRYADEMQGFEETDDRYIEMLNKRKAVKNVETGEVFKSVLAGEKSVGAANGTMYRVLNRFDRTLKGYHWITV